MLCAGSLAIAGVSPRADAFGSIVLRQLRETGYPGGIFLVNPRYETLDGDPCYPSFSALPTPVDCAVLALGNDRLETALLDAAAAGARSAVIFGTAHGLASDGRTLLTTRLAEIARGAGMAVCGPNGMGFYNFRDRLLMTGFPFGLEVRSGTVGLIAHSGSVFSAIAKNQRGLAFNVVISSGQELVTTAADYLRFLVEQPDTRVVGCYLETVRDGPAFLDALAAAEARDIPVVALKVGRSERGRALALAHSGALTGEDRVYQAVFERYNVVRVSSLDEMLDTLELFASGRRPTTDGLALASDSGGERALIVDVATDLGLTFAELAPETTARLAATLDPELLPVNPLDLWASGHDFERVYETALNALADDPATGMTVFAVDLPPASRLLSAYLAVAERVQAATEKPFAVLGNVATSVDRATAERLRSAGIPVLMGTTTGLAACRHLLAYQARHSYQPPSAPAPGDERVERWRARLQEMDGEALGERESKLLLADFGVPTTGDVVVTSATGAVRAAKAIGWAVVLKTAAPGILHKSDRGGVRLELRSAAEVRRAYHKLRATFGPGVSVQPFVDPRDKVELFLGLVRDEQFGPIVSVGFGGVAVELFSDVVAFLPPINADRANLLLRRLRCYPLLTGARGRARVDLIRLADAITSFSNLAVALGDILAAFDVNPLFAGPEGVVAVDSLAIPAATASGGLEPD